MARGPKPRHKSNIGVRIETPMRGYIEMWAAEEDRTISSMTRILLREAIWARLGLSPKGAKHAAKDLEEAYEKMEEHLQEIRETRPRKKKK